MVNISIDVTDLGGEARPGDKVVFWRPRMGGSATHAGRVISTAPVTVFLTDGKATVSDVEPGEMTVLLQCRGVESQGPVTVGVPDGDHTVTLRALLESQFEYAPPIVSAVQEAASNASASEEAAIQAQIRSEAAADRADAKVDDAINNGANLIRNEVKQDADRAVSARQSATQSESNAAASEGAAATSESNAKTSETNAKQSETNAGDYAAVATTAATEAVDAMESASDAVTAIGDSVSEAAGHADRASQSESGAAAYAQNASDAAERVGTAEQVGTWAQQAQDAADRIGTAETVEGWVNSARDSASTAAQSETKAKEYRDAAFNAADSTANEIRGDLSSIASEASRSASRAKTSETNAATHEANSLSAAERAELAAEETIQQVEGDFATRNYVDAAKWGRPRLANTTNIDLLTFEQHRGAYPVGSRNDATLLGLPLPNEGVFTVHWLAGVGTPVTIQVWEPYTGERLVRFLPQGGTWSVWRNKSTEGSWSRGAVVPGGKTADQLQFEADEGMWRVLRASDAEAMGLPDPGAGSFEVRWIAGSNTPYAIQIWRPVSGIATWERRNNSHGWSSWRSNTGGTTGTEVDLTAESRRDMLIASRGGRIGTAGKGVVAFRFDHNVRPFQDKILPLLEERGIPASMAHYVDEMDPQPGYSGSNEVGKTWADVTSQFFKGVEVWSHSWSHTDPADETALVREIVGSRTELEKKIPEAYVVGWMQPGLTGGRYGGYGDVFNAPEYHGTTRAGRLIDATYGADDRSGATHTPLGQRNFGCLWIDTASSALATNNAISEAARAGVGVVIALHPSMVDASNGISSATLTAILDHVVALRAAGDIEVLTVGGLSVADPGSSWRQNIAPPFTQWSGWGSGDSREGSPSSGVLSTSFSLGNHSYLAGHAREICVNASGSGEVQVRVKDRTGVSVLDVTRTFSVNGQSKLCMPFGVARTDNGLSVEITCTSGSVTITNAVVRAV